MRMVTLDIGPIWKMQLLQTFLEERGVPSFLPDSNLKTLDPTITGTLAFDARLEVPAERVVEARAALQEAEAELAELQRASRQQATLQAEGEVAAEPAPDAPPSSADFADARRLLARPEAAVEDLEELGRRLRWAVLLLVTQPFAVLYGWRYLRALARGAPRPRGHAFNVASLVVLVGSWIVLFEFLGLF